MAVAFLERRLFFFAGSFRGALQCLDTSFEQKGGKECHCCGTTSFYRCIRASVKLHFCTYMRIITYRTFSDYFHLFFDGHEKSETHQMNLRAASRHSAKRTTFAHHQRIMAQLEKQIKSGDRQDRCENRQSVKSSLPGAAANCLLAISNPPSLFFFAATSPRHAGGVFRHLHAIL